MSTPESKLKDYLVAEIQRRGWMMAKTSTPHWPDWTVAARKGQAGWIELKAPGKEPTEEQYEMLDRLADLGQTAGWAATREGVDHFLGLLGRKAGAPRAAKPTVGTLGTTGPKNGSKRALTTQPVGALRLRQKRANKALRELVGGMGVANK